MELIPEEHPMMQFVLRFLLVYHLSDPDKRSQQAQSFASAIAAREQALADKLAALVKAADDGAWHSSRDCEVEDRAHECDLCKALAAALHKED